MDGVSPLSEAAGGGDGSENVAVGGDASVAEPDAASQKEHSDSSEALRANAEREQQSQDPGDASSGDAVAGAADPFAFADPFAGDLVFDDAPATEGGAVGGDGAQSFFAEDETAQLELSLSPPSREEEAATLLAAVYRGHRERTKAQANSAADPADAGDGESGTEAQSPAVLYVEGTKVTCRFGGLDEYYPGVIEKVHDDKTYDILYDDGDRERHVKAELVRVMDPNAKQHDPELVELCTALKFPEAPESHVQSVVKFACIGSVKQDVAEAEAEAEREAQDAGVDEPAQNRSKTTAEDDHGRYLWSSYMNSYGGMGKKKWSGHRSRAMTWLRLALEALPEAACAEQACSAPSATPELSATPSVGWRHKVETLARMLLGNTRFWGRDAMFEPISQQPDLQKLRKSLRNVMKSTSRNAEETFFVGQGLGDILGRKNALPGCVPRCPWDRRDSAVQQSSGSHVSTAPRKQTKSHTTSAMSKAIGHVALAPEAGSTHGDSNVKAASAWTVAAAKIARRENESRQVVKKTTGIWRLDGDYLVSKHLHPMCGAGGRSSGGEFWVGGEYKPVYVWALLLLGAAVKSTFDARFRALCHNNGGTFIETPLKSVKTMFRHDLVGGKFFGLAEPTAACNLDIVRCTMLFDDAESLKAMYKRIWDQRLTPRGGVLSAVNSFLADADGGYGPRSGDEGILDPADALRKPYGYRCVTCNVAHMPTAADVNLANASSDDEEEEDGDQPEDGDDEDDMVDNTGEHWAQAQAEVNKLVDAAIYANGGRKFMDNGEVKELVHKLGLQWSKVLGQWWDDNAKDGSRRKIADSAVRSKLATEIHTARAVLRRASRAAAREKLGNRVLPLDESSSEVFWATLLQHPYTERAWKNLEDELRAEMGLDTWLRHREDFESAKQSIMACDDLMFTPVTFVGEIKLGLQSYADMQRRRQVVLEAFEADTPSAIVEKFVESTNHFAWTTKQLCGLWREADPSEPAKPTTN